MQHEFNKATIKANTDFYYGIHDHSYFIIFTVNKSSRFPKQSHKPLQGHTHHLILCALNNRLFFIFIPVNESAYCLRFHTHLARD